MGAFFLPGLSKEMRYSGGDTAVADSRVADADFHLKMIHR
jgi:hypothetical protein